MEKLGHSRLIGFKALIIIREKIIEEAYQLGDFMLKIVNRSPSFACDERIPNHEGHYSQ